MARSFRGRIPGPQPGEAGSIPARVTATKWWNSADTRRSERRALTAWEFKPLVEKNPEIAWHLLETLAERLSEQG